ncbi:hypothetical protein FJT64_000078 [Amphibalanus amphitrite]|uniref:Uncharacterized protein n=1 Tax=Amphibalanus amphitrite TaxID=1232801 RepID=A0A6A4W5N1_AMPAM|nr:hypothetical protein FJT64_025274 [Amphibalanus amphitrite]KAF0314719.1 hypothetical protein FJT64_000078 [Amphibalanus amphitrite]
MGGNRKTEESEALDEPVSCRAEDAASEDRQFRLVNLAALTPSSWPTGECLHSSSLAPPLRARVQTAVGPRASLAASTEETEALDNESVSGRTEDAASEDRQFWLGIWLL